MELGRIDLHEEGPELADSAPGLGGGLSQLRVEGRGGTLGSCRKRIRHAGEILDDAVVEVARDPPPFDVRRLDRAAQEAFSLAALRTRLASCHASGSWIRASRMSAPSMAGANWRKIRRARAEMKLDL